MVLRTTARRPSLRGWLTVTVICLVSALAAAWLLKADAPSAGAAADELPVAPAPPIPKSPVPEPSALQ